MPISLNVGLSKKIGLPNYSSLGAECHVEVELESQLLTRDPDAFREEVRQAFEACATAVQEELARHAPPRSPVAGPVADQVADPAAGSDSAPGTTQRPSDQGVGKGGRIPFARRPATGPQVRAITAISQRLSLDLLQELRSRFGVEEAGALTVGDASRFIDELQLLAEESGTRV